MITEVNAYKTSEQQKQALVIHEKAGNPARLVFSLDNATAPEIREVIEKTLNQEMIFKTSFIWNGNQLNQVINEKAEISFIQNEAYPAAFVPALAAPASGVHVQIFAQGNQPGVTAVIVIPAVYADYISLAILAKKLKDNCNPSATDVSKDDDIDYLQFSEWQHQIMESEEKEEALAYWSNKRAAGQQLNLLFDKDSYRTKIPATAVYKPESNLYELPAGVKPETFFGLCWQTVLWHYAQKEEFIIWYTHSSRDFDELKNTIGALARVLPLAVSFDEADCFSNRISEYQKVLDRDDEFKVFFNTGSDTVAVPDFLFTYAEINSPENSDNNAGFTLLDISTGSIASKIELRIVKYGNGYKPDFLYNTSAFDEKDIRQLGESMQLVVEQYRENPSLSIGGVQMLPQDNIIQLHHTFNNNTKTFDNENDTIDKVFNTIATGYADTFALVTAEGSITYTELNSAADKLATYMQGLGISTGDKAALMYSESKHLIIAMLALIKTGAAYVPLDPGNPAERNRFVMQNCGAKLVFSESGFEDLLRDSETGYVLTDKLDLAVMPVAVLNGGREPEIPVYVIYTSGTTGNPKGVVIPDKALINYVNWFSGSFSKKDITSSMLLSSYAFDLGYTAIWGTLLTGGTLHLVPAAFIKDPEYVIEYIAHHNISFIKTTPSLFHVLAGAANTGTIAGSNLGLVLLGGEPLNKKDITKFLKVNPVVKFVNHYGPTETTIGTVTALIDEDALSQSTTFSIIGRPVTNSYITILDENDRPLAPGITGCLCVSGRGLALGYLNNREQTLQKFTAHPFIPETLMYRTGDQASWRTDGTIAFAGRKDDQVKIRGFRVELDEVKAVLQQYKGINHVVITTVDNESFGRELAAYFVSDAAYSSEELRSFMKTLLPDAFIPAYFVRIKTLPLTANGKINKKELPDPLQDLAANKIAIAPRSETEMQLASLWLEVLQVENISVTDNFFDLGGHSLRAIQLSSRIHKVFDVKVDIGRIFSNPTIETLARLIQSTHISSHQHITPVAIQEYYETSHAQKRIWILSQFEGGSLAYNVPGVLKFNGKLDIKKLKSVFAVLISRHETLRTVFIEKDGEPYQVIQPSSSDVFSIEEINLQHHADAEELVKAHIRQDACKTFDLEKGPLLRATLIQLDIGSYVFIFNIHHIISDGWSRNLFTSELLKLYTGEGDLPPLNIQYKDYVSWHKKTLSVHEKYWHDVFSNESPVLNFPADFQRPEIITFSGNSIELLLSSELAASLKSLASSKKMTLNNLVFAAYGIHLSHYCNQEDIIIGSLVSGRSHEDTEKLMGVFMNFLPVRVKPGQHLLAEEYLERTNEVLVKGYQNQEYPFDMMVEKFAGRRDMSRNPFFDTMINFHWEEEVNPGAEPGEIHTEDLHISGYKTDDEINMQATLDFKLDIIPRADSFNFFLSFNTKLFKKETMDSFLKDFVRLLEDIVDNPGLQLHQYKKNNTGGNKNNKRTNVVICSSFVAEPFEPYIQYWSSNYELNTNVTFAPYNQVFQQLLNPQSIFNTNTKGINFLFIRPLDWIRDHGEKPAEEQISFLRETFNELSVAFSNSRRHNPATCFITIVSEDGYSINTVKLAAELSNICSRLKTYFSGLPFCYLMHTEEATNLYSVEEVFDSTTDEAGHIPFTQEFYAAFGSLMARRINAYQTSPRKVIVLDCDNTLWKGVCGEGEVIIDAFHEAIQQFLVKKYEEGFLLALCSKNNEEDVMDVFKRYLMPLKQEHICTSEINWEPKYGNIKKIAKTLNVGTDSFIFIDDSSFETEQILLFLPEVMCITLPENAPENTGFLDQVWGFDKLGITQEDTMRTSMYKAESEREKEKGKDALGDFLQSLQIEVQVKNLQTQDAERALQLINRTNQFNMNGIRFSTTELLKMIDDSNRINWLVEVSDRFGTYGQAGLLSGSIDEEKLKLDIFLLSCRVLGRNVENIILDRVKIFCAAKGIKEIVFNYAQTEKNMPFMRFYSNVKEKLRL